MHLIIPNLLNQINKFSIIPKYKLLDWINNINMEFVDNRNVLYTFRNDWPYKIINTKLEKKYISVSWYELSAHASNKILKREYSNSIKEKRPCKIIMSCLFKNINAIKLITHLLNPKKYLEGLSWDALCTNKNAIKLIKKIIEEQNMRISTCICSNENINKILNKCKKLDWSKLSLNPNAYNIIIKNLEYIDWSNARKNTSPEFYNLCLARIISPITLRLKRKKRKTYARIIV